VNVELLYFEGCPSYAAFLPRLERILEEAGLSGAPDLRRIGSQEEAERERFLGSPTLRIDGSDVEPGAEERVDFGMKCRLYRAERGLSRVPPDELVRAALKRVQA
jgi:hypothetical protein